MQLSCYIMYSLHFSATVNAGVENAGADRRGGKCRSRLAVWKAEPILYSDTALRYFLEIVFRILSE